jgi:hypothetical protein
MLNGLCSHKPGVLALALLLGLSLATETFAADKNPCPPIIPKPDPMKMAKAMSSSTMTHAKMMKLMGGYSRVIKKPAT